MSVQVIIYSSDRIRGGIVKEILRRNKITTLLLENIIDVKSAISSHLPIIVILDTSNSLRNEVSFIKSLVFSIDNCFIIILGEQLIINSFKDSNQNNLQNHDYLEIQSSFHHLICLKKKLFLSDPLDPDIIVAKTLEILSYFPFKIISEHKSGNNDEQINIDISSLPTINEKTTDHQQYKNQTQKQEQGQGQGQKQEQKQENNLDIEILENDLKQYLKLD